jgi:glutathione S-transferase
MSLTLYSNPMSRGRIARWMLEEAGRPYDIRMLPYGAAMQDGTYRQLNPMAKVPVLVHGDQVVTECAAICAYLADAFPDAALAPDPRDRADYYRWLFFAAGPLEQAVTNHSLGVEVPEDRRGMVGYGSYDRTMQALDTMLEDRPYITGADFSAADVYVGAQVIWGLGFKTIPATPALEAYRDRLTARPAFQRAKTLDDAAAEAMGPAAG